MLSHTPLSDVPVYATGTSQEILRWVADGTSLLLGFTATGSYPAIFRLLVDGDPWYTYKTSTAVPTAYAADRAVRLDAGVVVQLMAEHDSVSTEMYSATLLGGE